MQYQHSRFDNQNNNFSQRNTVTTKTNKCYFQIFFKAGVLAQLEDYRDEVLAAMMKKLQQQTRWWLAKTEYKRLHDQRWDYNDSLKDANHSQK